MARVNISVPDELVERARAAGLNVSRLASAAVADELDRLDKIAALDAYLAALEDELGPVPPKDAAAASKWADDLLSPAPRRPTSSRSRRTA